jgi:hypothetical protein
MLAMLAMVFTSEFIILTILLHLLNPEADALRFPLSIYRYALQGNLLITGLIMISMAEWILGILFIFTKNVLDKWLAVCMGIMGLSALLTGIFRMDIPPVHSVPGIIHIYAAIVQFVLFPVSMLLYSKGSFKPRTRNLVFGSGIFIVIMLLFMAYVVFTENPFLLKYYGLIQKLYIFLITLWLMVLASRFLNTDR